LLLKTPKADRAEKDNHNTKQPLENDLFLPTLRLHPNPKRTVKLNYIAGKSFTFLGADELEHLPKPAHTAYVIINGNGDHTQTAPNRSLERKPYTHTFQMKF